MGLAATQARFLSSTARKSNIEYQGQQINEQRTLLANKSSSIYNQMLMLKVPTPPSQSAFTKVNYTCTINGRTYEISEKDVNAITSTYTDTIAGSDSTYNYDDGAASPDIALTTKDSSGTITTTSFYGATRVNSTYTEAHPNSYEPISGRLSSLYLSATKFTGADAATADANYEASRIILTPNESVDEVAYNDAYNQYKYEQYLYEQQLEEINAKTATIQEQDKTLELQLKQLDTEQSAIKTELEALGKVIDDSIEGSFKTFG